MTSEFWRSAAWSIRRFNSFHLGWRLATALGEIGPIIDVAAQFIPLIVEGKQLLIARCAVDFAEELGIRSGRFRSFAASPTS